VGVVCSLPAARDLWRADLDGQHEERLTGSGVLNRGSASSDTSTYWRSAIYLPPRISPDGRWIVLSPTGLDLFIVNVSDGNLLRVPDRGAATAAWSPESDTAFAPTRSCFEFASQHPDLTDDRLGSTDTQFRVIRNWHRHGRSLPTATSTWVT
jgi:hypothetical protein